ncbi:MAG: polysaccharide deacetylase [Sulfurovum sp. FS06-10]|nr:MAG: polysaccharide deacetylase [Sulfurovum sp. FS06-10]
MIFWILLSILFLGFSLRYNWWRIPYSLKHTRILMYHSISEHVHVEKHNKWRVKPNDFEKQLKWFSQNGWTSYTVSELCSLESIPQKSFAITFDDGYEDNYTHAFPLLKRFNFKATIYLVPNQTSNHWEALPKESLSSLLTQDQIQTMQKSGLIEFGAHTLTHKNLLHVKEPLLSQEILKAKEAVEALTHTACQAFAYPYGKYNETIIETVKNAGYNNAVTVDRGLYTSQDNAFTIKRIGILGTESFFDFYLRITRIRNKL